MGAVLTSKVKSTTLASTRATATRPANDKALAAPSSPMAISMKASTRPVNVTAKALTNSRMACDTLACTNRTRKKAKALSTTQTGRFTTVNGVMIKRMETELTLIQMEIHTQATGIMINVTKRGVTRTEIPAANSRVHGTVASPRDQVKSFTAIIDTAATGLTACSRGQASTFSRLDASSSASTCPSR